MTSIIKERVSALKAAGYKFEKTENNKRFWINGNWESFKTALLTLGYVDNSGILTIQNDEKMNSVSYVNGKVTVQ